MQQRPSYPILGLPCEISGGAWFAHALRHDWGTPPSTRSLDGTRTMAPLSCAAVSEADQLWHRENGMRMPFSTPLALGHPFQDHHRQLDLPGTSNR